MLEEYDPYAVDYEPEVEALPPLSPPPVENSPLSSSVVHAEVDEGSCEVTDSLRTKNAESSQLLPLELTGNKRAREQLELEEPTKQHVTEIVGNQELQRTSGAVPMDVSTEKQKVLSMDFSNSFNESISDTVEILLVLCA
jgi:hypothetical protein